ncbi:MAG: hypothetical protein ACI8S6_005036 [Myxococcota bacterium]|jgi:hypothetical protein
MRALFLMFAACVPVASVDPSVYDAEPTYTDDIAPLMETWCVDCHASDGVMYDGVELDSFEGVRGTRVRSTCVTVTPDVVATFADSLLPSGGYTDLPACDPWEVASMPPGAMARPSLEEQILLARWVEIGAPQ